MNKAHEAAVAVAMAAYDWSAYPDPDGGGEPLWSAIDDAVRQALTFHTEGRLPQHHGPTDTWDYATHPGDCHPAKVDGAWTVCCAECAGTGMWPCPWIDTPEQGGPDETCVRCKGRGRAVVGIAS